MYDGIGRFFFTIQKQQNGDDSWMLDIETIRWYFIFAKSKRESEIDAGENTKGVKKQKTVRDGTEDEAGKETEGYI